MVEHTRHLTYQSIISKVLQAGYLVSMVTMVAGILMYLLKISGAVIVVEAGVFILLSTPLLRVITATITFYLIEKDRKYTLISLAVFLILLISIAIGRGI